MSMYQTNTCPVCKGTLQPAPSPDYLACNSCGHELLVHGDIQSHIINDSLGGGDTALKRTGLDRFQTEIVEKVAKERKLLVDFGCSSGRFLAGNRNRFSRAVGVEVTPECLQFARRERGLEVYERLPDTTEKASVITLWHSLEHFPFSAMEQILEDLKRVSDEKTRMIVSVPCNDGLQYRWFRKRFAYYDVPSHVSQFSRRSLKKLMGDYGFVDEAEFFSAPYVRFGYVQGFLNCMNRIHNYLYYRLKRGQRFGLGTTKLTLLDVYNFAGTAISLPFSFILSLYEWLVPERRSVVTLVFKKA